MSEPPAFHTVVLLPTYNNAPKLIGVLDQVVALGHTALVVNDGSTDDTAALLEAFLAKLDDADSVKVVHHERNRGKGAALRTGFAKARELGYTHALSMDTDGQHDTADAAALLATAEAQPTALVLGTRDANDPDYPSANRVGRVFSNLCIFIGSGRRIEDSQSGYRVYPLGLVETIPCRAGRYGYEAEILTRSGWAGCPLVQLPIRVIYPPGDERISHFRPWMDTLRSAALHLRLFARAVLPLPFKKWPPPEAHEAEADALPKQAWWKRVLLWFDPRELVRSARRDRVSQMSVAAGLGVGAFVANLPVYPVQTLVAVYLAKRLHLHPVSTVAGSQLAFPPVGLALIFAAIYLGHFVLTGEPPRWSDFSELGSLSFREIRGLMHEYFLSWWIGGVTLGTLIGLATFALGIALLKWVPVESESVVPE
ncbi:MAG: DUF2062 domain-containing protein [Planctomycetota bacterium]